MTTSKILLFVSILIPGLSGLNVLMVSIGAAGHAIPMFELARAMKNHNVTFITDTYAQFYVDLKSHSNVSSFRVVYLNHSEDAFTDNSKQIQELIAYITNHSLFDSMHYMISGLSLPIGALMNKTVSLLMEERYDVIVGTSVTFGLPSLCKDANTACVVLMAEIDLNIFDVNLPNSFSLLSTEHLSKFQYRIYNVAFAIRAITAGFTKMFNTYRSVIQHLPQVPGPFYETFSFRNLLRTQPNCLKLYSLPPTLFPSSYSSHVSKFLGAFVDENAIDNIDNDLTRWVQSKEQHSIVYVAFGSVSIVNVDRMRNLINGLAEFLLRTDTASVLLAFRNTNFDHYQTVFNEITNETYRDVLLDSQRVRVENQFISQKFILKQNAVALFFSHCGMNSIAEGFLFEKSILCLPLCTDQFTNAMAIQYSGAGQSLFQPPSMFKSLLHPTVYHDFTFSASDVTAKLHTMWRNVTYENAVRIMSLGMKHAGGVKRAVEEIEFFVKLNGNLDRYASFQSTLPFYQRYMLDILMVYMVTPLTIILVLIVKFPRRNRKEKTD